MSFHPKTFAAWSEIPVRDLDAGIAFYEAVTGARLRRMETDREPIALFQAEISGRSVPANLRVGVPEGAPASPTVFLTVLDSVEAAAERAWNVGGRVLSPVVSVPPGRYCYIADPDGNRVGLFEYT
ncbi:MAG: VOC family protein [Pseudomonadota bacterium]